MLAQGQGAFDVSPVVILSGKSRASGNRLVNCFKLKAEPGPLLAYESNAAEDVHAPAFFSQFTSPWNSLTKPTRRKLLDGRASSPAGRTAEKTGSELRTPLPAASGLPVGTAFSQRSTTRPWIGHSFGIFN